MFVTDPPIAAPPIVRESAARYAVAKPRMTTRPLRCVGMARFPFFELRHGLMFVPRPEPLKLPGSDSIKRIRTYRICFVRVKFFPDSRTRTDVVQSHKKCHVRPQRPWSRLSPRIEPSCGFRRYRAIWSTCRARESARLRWISPEPFRQSAFRVGSKSSRSSEENGLCWMLQADSPTPSFSSQSLTCCGRSRRSRDRRSEANRSSSAVPASRHLRCRRGDSRIGETHLRRYANERGRTRGIGFSNAFQGIPLRSGCLASLSVVCT